MRKPICILICSLFLLTLSGCDDFMARAREMDSNDNGKLSAREASRGLVYLADIDDFDGYVSEYELQESFADIGLLAEWDADNNGRVNATDFVFLFPQAVGDVDNRFSNWDRNGNGTLSNDELASSLFNKFDLNRDEILDAGEMEEIFVFYGGIEAYDQDDDGQLSFLEIEDLAVTRF